MSSRTADYLDGNAAAGDLSKIFGVDVTAAQGQRANCGAIKRFAERIYTCKLQASWRGAVRCLRARTPSSCKCSAARVLDMRGMTYLRLDTG